MVVYAPPQPRQFFVWVHGGSLWAGGANDPMLEGSQLALATNAVVVVVQYRLGVVRALAALVLTLQLSHVPHPIHSSDFSLRPLAKTATSVCVTWWQLSR